MCRPAHSLPWFLKDEGRRVDRMAIMDRLSSFLRGRREILRAAQKIRHREDREDAMQAGWVSVIARGSSRGVPRTMKEWQRHWKRGGLTDHADNQSPGIGELPTD